MRSMSVALTSNTDPNSANVDVVFCRTTDNEIGRIQETAQILHRRTSVKQSCLQKIQCSCCCPTNNHRQPTEYEFMTTVQNKNKKRKEPFKDPNTGVDWIDDMSKILFPATFIILNVFYWSAFLYWIPDEINEIPAIKEKSEKLLALASGIVSNDNTLKTTVGELFYDNMSIVMV